MKRFYDRIIEKDVLIYPLITFRIVFGLLVFVSTLRFIYLGWIDLHFIDTKVQFKYFGFHWVPLLSFFWIYVFHGLLLLSSLCVAIGLFYRISTVFLFFTFTYLELVDITYYLNHYYFVSLVAGLLIFLPAHRWLSIDAWRNPAIRTNKVKAWTINILKFQIAIVYIYAGLAKINYTWLIEALPLKIWLPANDKIPILGGLFANSLSPYVFSWAGMLYDTFIVFFLIFRPTRFYAYILVILFHTMVGILFQIGIFPLVMIGVTLIFFSDEWHERWQRRVNKAFDLKDNSERVTEFVIQKTRFNKGIRDVLIGFFVMFQLVFPWRYLLYPGDLFWNEEGYRFSWRVMLMEKAGTATFYVKDSQTGREGIVDNQEFLNSHQEKQMSFQPDLILQYAHFLGDHYEQEGLYKPEVRVEAYVTLNAQPSRLLIDPNLNLMEVQDSWSHKEWILD
ncbi:HTTM domain-containing protein [Jiulongibacter sp. NS-SX5]|uniref:HTTM domain-containing protein n=1 Tax=Jiulongibacter sp. NS-SX5 TaxID=3463854 RepID=UPI00405896E8